MMAPITNNLTKIVLLTIALTTATIITVIAIQVLAHNTDIFNSLISNSLIDSLSIAPYIIGSVLLIVEAGVLILNIGIDYDISRRVLNNTIIKHMNFNKLRTIRIM